MPALGSPGDTGGAGEQPDGPPEIPVVLVNSRMADEAYEAHTELVRAEAGNPRLRANSHWRALRDTAFARFRAAFSGTIR